MVESLFSLPHDVTAALLLERISYYILNSKKLKAIKKANSENLEKNIDRRVASATFEKGVLDALGELQKQNLLIWAKLDAASANQQATSLAIAKLETKVELHLKD